MYSVKNDTYNTSNRVKEIKRHVGGKKDLGKWNKSSPKTSISRLLRRAAAMVFLLLPNRRRLEKSGAIFVEATTFWDMYFVKQEVSEYFI